MNITIREFGKDDLGAVYAMLQNTFDVSYKDVYPEEAIDLFRNHYSESQIIENSADRYMILAEMDGEIVGTGALVGADVRMVYVSPEHQHKGIGRLIINELEEKAKSEKVPVLELGASLGSRRFWESLGYTVQKEDYVEVENDQRLYFYRMAKTL